MSVLRSRLVTNALANYVGQITIVAVGILLTPLIIAHLGTSMYGVWALVVSIQGLGGLLDLGVTTSVVKYVAEHRARNEIDEINRVVSSSFFLHLVIGVLTLLVVLAAALWGLPFLELHGSELSVARLSLVIAGASLMLMLPLGVLGNLLLGLRHYEVANGINVVQTIVAAAALVVALNMGGGPAELVAINGVSLVLALLVKWAFARRLLPGLHLSPRLANMATLRRIGSYSVWLFLLDTAKRIFYNADAVLIAAFLPVRNVTAYNLGFKPASAVSYLSGPMVSVFMPAASEMEARSESVRLQRLLLLGTRIAMALTLAAALWLLTFGRQIMEVWVGPGHEDALPVLYVFLGVFAVSAAQNASGAVLKGIGRVKAMSVAVLVEYVANIALSVALIPAVGIVGAALGTLIPEVVNDLLVIPWLVCRAIRLDYWRFMRDTLLRPAAAAVPTLVLLWLLSMWLPGGTLLSVGAGGLASAVLYGLFYLLIGASREERAALVAKLNPGRSLAPGKRADVAYETSAKHTDTNPEQARSAGADSGHP